MQSHAPTTDVGDLVRDLDRLLSEELAAIRALDARRLQAITERKAELAETLAGLASHATMDHGLRELTRAVRARAEASALLLTEAASAVAEALGVGADSTTYDQNARRVHAVRAITRRAI